MEYQQVLHFYFRCFFGLITQGTILEVIDADQKYPTAGILGGVAPSVACWAWLFKQLCRGKYDDSYFGSKK